MANGDANQGTWLTRWLFAAGRATGFVLFASLALCIVGAVVLVPQWAKLQRDCYERDLEAARVEDTRGLIADQDRLIHDLLTDPVLTKRLALNQGDHWPQNAVVMVENSDQPELPPWVLRRPPVARPDPPSAWLMRLDQKLQRPRARRGLLLVSAALLALALFLFSPTGVYRRRLKSDAREDIVGVDEPTAPKAPDERSHEPQA